MAKREEKELAIYLRKKGQSYSEIRKKVQVSKSTLSLWLRDYPLSAAQLRNLKNKRSEAREKYIKTRKAKRKIILDKFYSEEKKRILPLLKNSQFVFGLALYWAEGAKFKNMTELRFTNSDPAMVKAFIDWTIHIGVPREKLKARLHLYKDMNVRKETTFWIKKLDIERTQFYKPYIKDSSFANLTYKSGFGHGTCNVGFYDAKLGKQIFMGIKVLQDYFAPIV